MGMYDICEVGMICLVAVLGAVMFFSPEKSTKAENRSDEAAVAKTKRSGLILMVVGIICAVAIICMKSM